MIEINFGDPELFYKGVKVHDWFLEEDGEFRELKPEWKTLAHVMHAAGVFPSVGEARRNGWDKPIPPGWSDYKVGKGPQKGMYKYWISVLSKYPNWDKPDEWWAIGTETGQ